MTNVISVREVALQSTADLGRRRGEGEFIIRTRGKEGYYYP